jgi:hypothetical protein
LLFGTAPIGLIAEVLGYRHVLFGIVELAANLKTACRCLVSGSTDGLFNASDPVVNVLTQALFEMLADPD